MQLKVLRLTTSQRRKSYGIYPSPPVTCSSDTNSHDSHFRKSSGSSSATASMQYALSSIELPIDSAVESDFNKRRRFSFAAYVPHQIVNSSSAADFKAIAASSSDADSISLSFSTVCVICLGPVDKTLLPAGQPSQIVLLPCSHMFCNGCVQRILMDPQQPCPACRTVSIQDVARMEAVEAKVLNCKEPAVEITTNIRQNDLISERTMRMRIRRFFAILCVSAIATAVAYIAVHFNR